ncbi:DNA segregation ATPase FtsK/SpoIIIE, S-DNA-T family [Plantibacter flavus]|uniref:S-DNA-T family DNA segregation ATPase FtsK/SpoIIIE n=1 Tax=Plantibacter flavus TaxID=150123 RepID=A0A3N2C3Y6_9MICO|nr:FtsK/SpoIIIE domain-containing protein [Plantibacter flavus]ROR82238.1 S-DNA-T family DNA segregation ATPase FtsK/SpoIIIE [Plantibacter flavus]SMG42598.1 DNA segregation ATPase FtsK/SpoIIIE, S-DNA-T family [Plantibacter flavus]
MRLSLTIPSTNRRPGADHPAPSGQDDVLLEVDEQVTVGEVAAALDLAPEVIAPDVDPEHELATTDVRNGAVLPRVVGERLPVGTLRLEFVAGPFAGETVALPAGVSISVGQAVGAHLRLLDPAVDDQHATIQVPRAGSLPDAADPRRESASTSIPPVTIEPRSEHGRTLVNGAPIAETTELGADDLVQIGASIVRLGRQPRSDADTMPDALGTTAFNRAARIRPPAQQPTVKLPGERPTSSDRAPLPWLSALVPVVIGVGSALAFGRPFMLLMAAASPLMVVASYLTSRKLAKRTGRRTLETWAAEVTETGETIERIRRTQRIRSWRTNLDPVSIADVATTPTARLWERRLGDDDAALVRVGVGEMDLDVRYEGRRARADGEPITIGVSPVPMSVDLTAGVVGIAGSRKVALGIARSMVTALAVTRSPRDLRLVLLCGEEAAADWSWFRWLPHADGGQAALKLVGNTDDSRLTRIRELTAVLESRRAARSTSSRTAFDAHVVVVIDEARAWRTLPGMVSLLEHGPGVGIFVIALEEDRARLPEESATEVLVDPLDPTMGSVESTSARAIRILFDVTTARQAETIARALAPVVHVGGAGDDTMLPRSVRFVDLVSLDLDDPEAIITSWLYRPRETRGVVGAGQDGAFALDLAADGPHGLVAGTTGAGKSEFLQTLVVSLALANRPDALTFVLVDYKGGSAFADCERLPHTVGLVTNLDGRETERALESLDAELKRRERVLVDLGAKDADTAWEKDPEAAAARGLARLVLVIDEFAELKSELPDFVSGLVRIARVGRSLGVHLILATQRPSGAITPEMQSNTNLRVALRVTDKADSTDILGSPEAASIAASTPGRGYARRGPGAAPAAFQTARVAGRRPGVAHTVAAPPAVLRRGWRDLGAPVRFPANAAPTTPVDHDDTDLRAIVDVITRATDRLGITKNPSPWLDPLPELLTLDDIPPAHGQGAIVLGLEDVPSEQAQRTLEWSVVTDSHLAFIGGARSGRTSILRTMVAQLAERFPPEDLHLHAIDYGNGALAPMADLPHCGAVVTPLESGRLGRFLNRLSDEIAMRQRVLAGRGVGDLVELRSMVSRSDGTAPPFVVVVVDGYERLIASAGDGARELRDVFVDLLRDGPAVGVRVVITADRTFYADRIQAYFDQRITLPFTDRGDYQLARIRTSSLPAHIPPGRAFFDTPLREAQLALLAGGTSSAEQASTFGQSTADRGPTPARGPAKPFRVDELPDAISVREASRLPLADSAEPHDVLLGVGGDELSQRRAKPDSGILIAGERRSGRSSALAMIAEQLYALDRPTIVVALRDSPARLTASRLHLPLVTSADLDREQFVAVFRPAKEQAQAQGLRSICVLIDDVELLSGTTLEQALLGNLEILSCIVVALADELGVYKSLVQEARLGKVGLILSPQNQTHGTNAFGTAIPREFLGRAPSGRGVLYSDGEFSWVQAPLPAL